MHILVTGCNGYIGSHVVKNLAGHGYKISGLDIDVHGESNDVTQYLTKFYLHDIRSKFNGEYDAIVHLAGLATVSESMSAPYSYYETNIFGTKTLLDHTQSNHFLFASTSSAWEMASPYARSKVAAEDVIRQQHSDYTIFRFFNVSGTNGEFKQLGPATHLIRVAAEVAANRRSCLEIFGTDYNTHDGTCVRDYVHVMDLADAITQSIITGPARTPYECIGSNHGYSVFEVVDTMRRVSGHNIPVKLSSRRTGDAVCSVVDKLSDLVTLSRTLEDMCLDQYHLELKTSTINRQQ